MVLRALVIVSGLVGNPESSRVNKRSPKKKSKSKLQIPGLVPVRCLLVKSLIFAYNIDVANPCKVSH